MTTSERALREIVTTVEGGPLRGMADLDAGMLLGIPELLQYAPGPHKTVPPGPGYAAEGGETQAVSPRRRSKT